MAEYVDEDDSRVPLSLELDGRQLSQTDLMQVDPEVSHFPTAVVNKFLRTNLGAVPQEGGPGEERPRKGQFYWECSWRGLFPGFNCARGGSFDVEPTTFPRRKTIWLSHGQPMHVWSLEFQDDQLECVFQLDLARRQWRWVRRLLVPTALAVIVIAVTRVVSGGHFAKSWDHDSFNAFWLPEVIVPGVGGTLLLLQYVQMLLDKGFVLHHFQRVLFFWSLCAMLLVVVVTVTSVLHMAALPFCVPHGHRKDNAFTDLLLEEYLMLRRLQYITDSCILSFILLASIIYRMRFIYVFYLMAIVLGAYGLHFLELAPECWRIDGHKTLVIGSIVASPLLSFLVEFVHRKDFIYHSAVFEETQRTAWLLGNILPAPIVEEMMKGNEYIVASHASVSILFADIVNFTSMSAMMTPGALVSLLDELFLAFDTLAEENFLEKIKTIGDCYMAAGGVPIRTADHAATAARMGLGMVRHMRTVDIRNPITNRSLMVRIGVHTGPAVSGIIGNTKFCYDLWGDAVNTASRMESHGEPMKVHCSADTSALLQDRFVLTDRGVMNVKGKGKMRTYFVESELIAKRSQDGPSPLPSARLPPFAESQSNFSGWVKTLSRSITSFGSSAPGYEFRRMLPEPVRSRSRASNMELVSISHSESPPGVKSF